MSLLMDFTWQPVQSLDWQLGTWSLWGNLAAVNRWSLLLPPHHGSMCGILVLTGKGILPSVCDFSTEHRSTCHCVFSGVLRLRCVSTWVGTFPSVCRPLAVFPGSQASTRTHRNPHKCTSFPRPPFLLCLGSNLDQP